MLKGVIAALWEFMDPSDIPVDTVFILNSSLKRLARDIEIYHAYEKKVYVDMDFVDGLSEGEAAVEYLRTIGVDGIISVKLRNFHCAHKLNIPFVLRIFSLDSRAVEKAYNQVVVNSVDTIEVLPGCAAFKVAPKFKAMGVNVVAAGLVSTKEELGKLLQVVDAVSTSSRRLWG